MLAAITTGICLLVGYPFAYFAVTRSPLVRNLAGLTMYKLGADGFFTPTYEPNVTAAFQQNPTGAVGRDVYLLDHATNTTSEKYGSDNLGGNGLVLPCQRERFADHSRETFDVALARAVATMAWLAVWCGVRTGRRVISGWPRGTWPTLE